MVLIEVPYFIKLVDFDPSDIVESWERPAFYICTQFRDVTAFLSSE